MKSALLLLDGTGTRDHALHRSLLTSSQLAPIMKLVTAVCGSFWQCSQQITWIVGERVAFVRSSLSSRISKFTFNPGICTGQQQALQAIKRLGLLQNITL